ncbi:MAG: hypothetical protein GY909_15345 [Oligoflexia bacterium]|nr:hypothetical protein [Oligoflexia bacterium]
MERVKEGLQRLNKWLKDKNLKIELHTIGSYALHLHGVDISRETDIDPVNVVEDEQILQQIRDISANIGHQWFDHGSSSITLPDGYKDRVILKERLSNIDIYVLDIKDLIILKVSAYYSRKEQGIIRDLEDLIKINPSMVDIDDAFSFIIEKHGKELPQKFENQLIANLKELRDELSTYFK